MKSTARRITLALAAWAGLALAGALAPALAQDTKERDLKSPLSFAKDHPMGQGAQIFADLVGKKSSGKIMFTVYPAAVLGSDQRNLEPLVAEVSREQASMRGAK